MGCMVECTPIKVMQLVSLLAHEPLSSLAYPMITHTPPVAAGNLPLKTKGWSTNNITQFGVWSIQTLSLPMLGIFGCCFLVAMVYKRHDGEARESIFSLTDKYSCHLAIAPCRITRHNISHYSGSLAMLTCCE